MGRGSGGGVTATALVVHPDCSLHDTGWKHPDHQGRLPAAVRAIERDMPTLHPHLVEIVARPATESELLRVHTPEHLDRVRGAAGTVLSAIGAVGWGAETPLGTRNIFASDPGVHLISGAFGGAELEAAVSMAAPEWIFLSAEFGDDPEPVHERTRLLRECAEAACSGRLVSVLEGGYEVTALGKAVVQHLRALAGLPPA